MKMFLATLPSKKYNKVLMDAGCTNYLFSYFYAKQRGADQFTNEIAQNKKVLLVDSGAHSLQQSKFKVDYDKFVHDYAHYVAARPWIDYFVELDIDNKVGREQVEKWRAQITSITGRTPIVVWHPTLGKDYWLWMIKKYPYVGFSCIENELKLEYWPWFLKTSSEAGVKVHGFAMTRMGMIYKFPFFSVDSTSWASAYRFGTMNVSQDGVLRQAKTKGKIRVGKPAQFVSAREWVNLQKRVEEYWEKREARL